MIIDGEQIQVGAIVNYKKENPVKYLGQDVTEDGEIVNVWAAPTDARLSIRTPEQDKAWQNLKEKQRNMDERNFTFGDIDTIGEVANILTETQCSYIIRLQAQIDYNSILRYDNNKFLDKKGMKKMLKLEGTKESYFYDFFNKCIDNNIIIEHEDNTFAINPRYHFKGALKGQKAFKAFNDMVKQLYDELKLDDFGLVYKMLPFLNFEYNVLCNNPEERDITKIQYITTQELADLLNFSRKQLTNKIQTLKYDRHFVVATVRVGRTCKYYINPLVFSRKGTYPTAKEMEMFQIN